MGKEYENEHEIEILSSELLNIKSLLVLLTVASIPYPLRWVAWLHLYW